MRQSVRVQKLFDLIILSILFGVIFLHPVPASGGTEMVLEVRNHFQTPTFPPGIKFMPEGSVANSGGYTTTTEKYYCRESSAGYLIETGDKDWEQIIGKEPAFLGDKIIARYGNERLIRFSKDAPIQYADSIETMTNKLKNGFQPMDQEAAGILSVTNLGIGDMFEMVAKEKTQDDNSLLTLKLKTFPDILYRGILVFSNHAPLSLNITFTNQYMDTMRYHYEYSMVGNGGGLAFNTIHLIVSNLSRNTITFARDVRILFFRQAANSKRSDFGFDIKVPENKLWTWQGDKIKGMDARIANITKSAAFDPVTDKQSSVVWIRILIISMMILPLLIFLGWTLFNKKTKLDKMKIKGS